MFAPRKYLERGKWTKIVNSKGDGLKLTRSQPYDSIVSVILIKGQIELNDDYYIRLKLGTKIFKSKIISRIISKPYWGQHFDMHFCEDQFKVLEIGLVFADNHQPVAKICIDLSELEPEQMHSFVHQFPIDIDEHQAKTLFKQDQHYATVEMLITITGTQHSTPSIDYLFKSNLWLNQYDSLSNIWNICNDLSNVGILMVKGKNMGLF